jgi:uncharacterized protein HemX
MIDRDKFEEMPNGQEKQAELRTVSKGTEEDVRVEQALADFRASVRNWSDTAYSRPRAAELTVRRRNWRLAAGWALGCVLATGALTGGLVEHQRHQEAARIAAQQAHQQRLAEARQQTRQEDRKLMTSVDNEISQKVPSSMEPLAQLMQMDDGETP